MNFEQLTEILPSKEKFQNIPQEFNEYVLSVEYFLINIESFHNYEQNTNLFMNILIHVIQLGLCCASE